MWLTQLKTKKGLLEFYGENPIKLLEDSCKEIKMQDYIHNPFTLHDLKTHQFKLVFGKLIAFRLWLLEQPEKTTLNIGRSPEHLPDVIEDSDIVSKIQFRKYSDLWDKFIREIGRY